MRSAPHFAAGPPSRVSEGLIGSRDACPRNVSGRSGVRQSFSTCSMNRRAESTWRIRSCRMCARAPVYSKIPLLRCRAARLSATGEYHPPSVPSRGHFSEGPLRLSAGDHQVSDAANQARYSETILMTTAAPLTTRAARIRRYVIECRSERIAELFGIPAECGFEFSRGISRSKLAISASTEDQFGSRIGLFSKLHVICQLAQEKRSPAGPSTGWTKMNAPPSGRLVAPSLDYF